MPDFDRILSPNPFAGDDGSIQPEVEVAFRAPAHERTEAIVSTLDRVIMPVLPHAHPGKIESESGITVASHTPAPKDPLECPDEDLVRVPFPGGRESFPAFSSAQALAAWNPQARPVPVKIESLAVAALRRGSGLITLDPDQDSQTWLGRSAVISLAAGGTWLAPWKDEKIREKILEDASGSDGLVDVTIEPGDGGAAIINLHIDPGSDRDAVMNIAHTVIAILGANEYVKARLDVAEVRPVPASSAN